MEKSLTTRKNRYANASVKAEKSVIAFKSLSKPLNGVVKRLEDLAILKDGWYDGIQGKSLNRTSLHWLAGAFDSYYDLALPIPSLYPTLDGKVQAEWSLPLHELSMTFDIENKTIAYHFLQLDTDETNEGSMSLNSVSDWQMVNSLLKKYKND